MSESDDRSYGIVIILENLVTILSHDWMEERSGWNDDCGTAGMFDRRAIFHDRADIRRTFSLISYRCAKQSHECLVIQDPLCYRVQEKTGVDERLARTLLFNGTFGEPCELLPAGCLTLDSSLDLPNEKERILDGRLAERNCQTCAKRTVEVLSNFVPIAEALNGHEV